MKTIAQIRFPCNANSKYAPILPDNSNPIYADKIDKPNFKYTQQGRFCLRMATVKLLNGTAVGQKRNVLDYTCKILVSINEYEILIKDEID